MSAFVIDQNTMRSVVRAITARSRYGQLIARFDGVATETANAATIIGRRLFVMNIKAVTQRYPDARSNPDNLPGPHNAAQLADSFTADYAQGRECPQRTLIGCYRAMRSLRYQCSEGDIPETPLYAELVEAMGTVAGEIVSRLPEYEAAEG